jgi:hypothetical protein
MILDKKREFDHRTGIRHDSFQEKFFIGSSVLEFMGKDIKVDNNFYKTTPGLYELLFKNNPKKYTQNDLSTYIVVYLTSLCVNWAFFDTRGLVSLAF